MWTKFRKMLLILVVSSLIMPTSALDVIGSVYAQGMENETELSEVVNSNENNLDSSTDEQVPPQDSNNEAEGELLPPQTEETPKDDENTSTDNPEIPGGEEGVTEDSNTLPEGEQLPSEDTNSPDTGEQLPSDEVEIPTEDEQTPSEDAQAEEDGQEAVVEEEEVIDEEVEFVPEALNFIVNPNVRFLPNLRSVNPYQTLAEEITISNYLHNGFMATAIADLNTSNFPTSTTTGNNGRVWIDKSVTLDGNHNYGAPLNKNEFSVILSALGQEYITQETENIPADVVFVLDVSGSMSSTVKGSSITRAQAAVNAINTAITKLMETDSNTRVAVVTFSGPSRATSDISANDYAKVLLPLASYKATDKDIKDGYPYLKFSTSGKEDNKTYTVSKATNLNVSGAEVSSVNFTGGTYTQAGIQKGAQLLVKAESKGNRVPAMILVSDGRPTYGTSKYTKVETSEYGNGTEVNNDIAGKMGYYTTLTAQYQKNQIKTSGYTKNPLIYTLGLGITDKFGKTVLNPTSININSLSTSEEPQKELRSLLTNSDNPYKNQCYADYSQSGAFTAEDINSLLANMVGTITRTGQSPFSATGKETAITFTDEIGEGMEVKGNTIYVRYQGINYPFTKQNSGTFISNTQITVTNDFNTSVILNNVTIKITETNGIQTLTWEIPAELVPVYSNFDEYALTLPIRLIYNVGLKSSENTLSKDYYTNAFTNAGSQINPKTKATFTLANDNPYNSMITANPVIKPNNETQTATHATQMSLNNNTVTAVLGNNGKVTLNDVKRNVTVEKVWDDFENNHQTRPTEIKVQLKQNDKNYGDPVILKANNWSHTWNNLPTYNSDNTPYTYSVAELTTSENYLAPIYTEVEGKLIITNTLKNEISKTVMKQWEDNNNELGKRPESIEVQLLRNDSNLGVPITLEENNWTYTWSSLLKYDKAGNEYEYKVVEVGNLTEYDPTYTIESNGTLVITNKLVKTERTVTKIWDDFDNKYENRPERIIVQLKQNGNNYRDEIILSNENNWTYTWEDLPKFISNNSEYVYTVAEITTSDFYTTTYSEDTFTITNKLVDPGTVKIVKLDKSGNGLSGVKFLIEKLENNEWLQVKEELTNEVGELLTQDLLVGRYRITEIQTLEGLTLLDSPIEFDLPYDEDSVVLPKGVTIVATTDNNGMPYLTITIKNNKNGFLDNLPSTGGPGIMMFSLGGAALMMIAVPLYINQKRNKNLNQK